MTTSQQTLREERSYSVYFYNMFRGNANENLLFPRINIILIHLR